MADCACRGRWLYGEIQVSLTSFASSVCLLLENSTLSLAYTQSLVCTYRQAAALVDLTHRPCAPNLMFYISFTQAHHLYDSLSLVICLGKIANNITHSCLLFGNRMTCLLSTVLQRLSLLSLSVFLCEFLLAISYHLSFVWLLCNCWGVC